MSFFRFEILTDETLENSLKIQLKKYIDEYLVKYARRPKTVRRQEKLEEIYEIYKNLSLDEQISEAVSTAYQIGTLNKIQIQFSFIENPDQTNLPEYSDSD